MLEMKPLRKLFEKKEEREKRKKKRKAEDKKRKVDRNDPGPLPHIRS